MAAAPSEELRRRLRAQRQAEFEALSRERLPDPVRPDPPSHRASAVCLLSDERELLQRIDQAQTAMQAVLQAWDRDPARRGAHLLARNPGTEMPGAVGGLKDGPGNGRDEGPDTELALDGTLDGAAGDTQPI